MELSRLTFIPSSLTRLFIAALLIFGTFSTNAGHVSGSEISYQYISSSQYKITLKVFRDCRGIVPAAVETLSISSSDTQSIKSIFVYRRSIEKLSVRSMDETHCQGSFSEGWEIHTYDTIIDLSGAPFSAKICNYRFTWINCCRNSMIGLQDSSVNYALLNRCYGNNNSPVFALYPQMSIPCNHPATESIGGVDSLDKNDSLVFSLGPALYGMTKTHSYYPPYTSVESPIYSYYPSGKHIVCPGCKPPQGFYLNPATGLMIFTPANCAQIDFPVYEISDYRQTSSGPVRVGFVRREVMVISKTNGLNKNPEITGADSITVVAGINNCYVYQSSDSSIDTTSMQINPVLPGASFTYLNPSNPIKSAKLCWNPDTSRIRLQPYLLTIDVKDNLRSGLKGFNRKLVRVYVRYPMKGDSVRIDPGACNRYRFRAFTDSVYTDGYKVEWEIRDFKSSSKDFYYSFPDTGNFTVNCRIIPHNPLIAVKEISKMVRIDTLRLNARLPLDTLLCGADTFRYDPVVRNITGTASYLWEYPGGSSNSRNISFAALDSEYSLKLIFTVSDSSACSFRDSIILRHGKRPQITLRLSTGDTTLCDRSTFILADSVQAYHYSWLIGNLTAAGNGLARVEVLQKSNINLRVSSAQGCTWDTGFRVKIFPKPKAGFGMSDTALCSGKEAILLNDSSIFPFDYLHRNWHFGDGESAWGFNASHTYSSAGLHTVKLIVHTDSGCYDSVQKSLNVLPFAKARIWTNDSSQCISNNLFHIRDSSSSAVAYSNLWRYGNSSSASKHLQIIFNSATSNYKVVLITTTDRGCVDSTFQMINVSPELRLEPRILTDSVQCNLGNSFDFIDQTDYSGSPLAGRWWNFDGNATSTNPTISHSFSGAGLHSVRLSATNQGGCNADTIFYIRLKADPARPLITRNGDMLSISNFYPSNTYLWYKDGTQIANADSQFYLTRFLGNFSVKVDSSNGCSIFSELFPVAVLGMDAGIPAGIRIYPNPASEFIIIHIPKSDDWHLKITDSKGRIHLEKPIGAIDPGIDVSGLSNGLYYLFLEDSEGKLFCKGFIIQR